MLYAWRAGPTNGCPIYNYSHTSLVTADQYTPGDHYANQVNIWGGLGQLSLNMLTARHTDELSASTFTAGGAETEPGVLETAYTYYDDVQLWIMEHYPDSLAARSYLSAAEQLSGGTATFAADSDYYTYIYQPSVPGWQTVAVIGRPPAAWTRHPARGRGILRKLERRTADGQRQLRRKLYRQCG